MSGYVILRGQGPEAILRVGPDPAPFTVPISGGGFAVCRLSSTSPVLDPPDAFTDNMWVIEEDGRITINVLPDGNGSPITAIEYRRNGGSPIALTGAGVGSYTTLVRPGDTVEIRAVNAVGPGAWSDVKTQPAAVTPWSREFTAGIGSVVIDLATIGPAESGTATYALVGSLTGVSLAGKNLTVNTATAVDGTITARRTDNAGIRNLVLTLDIVTASITVIAEAATVDVGQDDPPATTYALTITGGAYGGQTVSFTKAELDAIPSGQGRPVLAPVIALTTDANSNGQLNAGDVATFTRAGLRVHRTGQTPPSTTGEWHRNGLPTGVTAATFTSAVAAGALTYVETDGTTASPSNSITIVAAGPDWAFSGRLITSSPIVPQPVVSGRLITG